ncbi:hypothetical protein Dfri01_06640 [Dyadobacter frigoris]|nr:hypothetical protein Dfri01_06640 [Dyadobacter frigoris]
MNNIGINILKSSPAADNNVFTPVDYVIHTTVISHLTMIKAEEFFLSPAFLRVHWSFIVRKSACKPGFLTKILSEYLSKF